MRLKMRLGYIYESSVGARKIDALEDLRMYITGEELNAEFIPLFCVVLI